MSSMISEVSRALQHAPAKPISAWHRCKYCSLPPQRVFKSDHEFMQHLRDYHCMREGGSFVCKYGRNNFCYSLPIEGVNEKDYIDHAIKKHIWPDDSHINSTGQVTMQTPQKEEAVVNKDSSHGYSQQNVLASSEPKWSLYDSSQNLAAVLNDPRRSTREADFFTKTWDDTFVCKTTVPPAPHLPEVSSRFFDRYLKRTLKRNRRLKTLYQSQDHTEGLSRSLAALLDKALPELDTIPKVFLNPSFSLEDPDTFNTVLPPSQLMVKSSEGNSQPSSKLLQERLSHHLDTVEVQIARQVSLKSEAFFQAMTSHDALMDQLAFNIKAVSLLRKKIMRIDEVLVKQSLHVLRLKQSWQNNQQVYDKLKLMATVHQAQPTIQLLLATSDFVGALDLIRTTQEIAAQELVGIHSFRHLNSQLMEMERIIVKMMEADFVRYIAADLNRPLSDDAQILEEEHLVAIIYGMLRLGKFDFVETYREEARTAINAIVKQTEIEVVSQLDHGDTADQCGNLSEQIHLLKFNSWLSLLQKVFKNLLLLLQRIKAVEGVMQDVVKLSVDLPSEESNAQDSAKSAGNNMSSLDFRLSVSEHLRLSKSLKDMLDHVCGFAGEKCGKLVTARAKDNSLGKIQTSEFVILVQSIDDFCQSCLEISDKPCSILRQTLRNQTGRYVLRFHEDKRIKLGLILDSEQWKQADVPAEFQELVNHISRTGQLVVPKKLSQGDENLKPQPVLIVDSQRFAVVGTVLMLLRMVIEYCQFAFDVPILARDLAKYLVDILQFFNSRTCQLVLGAGAIEVVGLKTITTKNLALVLRCLQLILHYIPKVNDQFEQLISPRQQTVSKHFDQVIKDYKNHINEIINKFVAILDNIIESQLSRWEVKAPVPSPYFRQLSKHLSKLHEAVSDILLKEQLHELFRRIHISFREKLRTHLIRLKVSNDGGPQHGLVTQELTFYIENLRILQIAQDENQNLEDFWPVR